VEQTVEQTWNRLGTDAPFFKKSVSEGMTLPLSERFENSVPLVRSKGISKRPDSCHGFGNRVQGSALAAPAKQRMAQRDIRRREETNLRAARNLA